MNEDELAHWAGDVTEPLDEDELPALWRVARRDLDNPATTTSRAADAWDTLRLILEVRRLRAELAARPAVPALFNRATYDELGEDAW